MDKRDSANTINCPQAIFAIDFARSDVEHLLTLLIPLLLIFFLNIFTLSIEQSLKTRMIAISSGSVTALLAYKFVIEKMSPESDYFMISDFIFFLILAMVFIIYLININNNKLSEKSKKIVIVLLHLIVIVTIAYLLYFY